jgi:hypothetical protein
MNELKTRDTNDVLIAMVDGLKSLPSRRRGLFRGDRHGLSADHGANLHRSSDPQFARPLCRGRTASALCLV